MRNYVQKGETLPFTAPTGGVEGGKGYLIGAIFCVAVASIAAGDQFQGMVEGVFCLPSATGSGSNFDEGAKLYWDDTNDVVTKTATGNTFIGHAVEAKLVAGVEAVVRLAPGGA